MFDASIRFGVTANPSIVEMDRLYVIRNRRRLFA